MADVPTIEWAGSSGTKYKYWIHKIGTDFNAKPGNYCFAKESSPGRWTPLYFGQTGDLSERFDDHHKMGCAKRNGATHIHAHVSEGGERARLDEESDLIKKWNPTCNG